MAAMDMVLKFIGIQMTALGGIGIGMWFEQPLAFAGSLAVVCLGSLLAIAGDAALVWRWR